MRMLMLARLACRRTLNPAAVSLARPVGKVLVDASFGERYRRILGFSENPSTHCIATVSLRLRGHHLAESPLVVKRRLRSSPTA